MVSRIAGIVETITGFFEQLVESGYLTLDYIFYVSLAFELVLIVFFLIKSSYSYELRLDRSLDGLNRWLYYNQFLDETNLIEFNNRIKRSPKLLRYHWQQYMLYREKEPSHYISAYNCVEKPVKTSSFLSNIKNLSTICYTLAIATFVLGLTSFASVANTNIGYVLLNTLLTPIAIIVFSTFFTILLRSWQNSNLAGLYQNFHLFTRYIDKACTTLPQYIDFEVLFTKDEIKRGIPVLNEFLEKRARQEQKELEEAMKNSVYHEDYDFSHLGLSGAQILERAMKETEIFLNQRQRTLAEIQQLEGEIESSKRNYENNQKEYQRKMQASKENIERLRKQQEESTNRIENNYIRKQQNDEIKKQEQLEKDYEGVTLRYNQDINTLTSEIHLRRTELEERKKIVENAMQAEYQTFSGTVYKELKADAREKEKSEKQKLAEEKDNYATLLQQSNLQLVEKETELKRLLEIIKQSDINLAKHGEFYSEDLRKEAKQRSKKSKQSKNTSQTQEQVQKDNQENNQLVDTTTAPVLEEVKNPEYDEFGGFYDSQGYYRYKNGTYYDTQGNFHDEFGGYYDKDGNYFPPQNQTAQIVEEVKPETAESMVEEHKAQELVTETQEQAAEQKQEPVYDEFGGYYDSQGYYRYKNGTYYDPQGNYHDEFGGYYDKDGNYFPPQNQTAQAVEEVKPETTKNMVEEVKAETQKLDENTLAQINDFEEITPEEDDEKPAEVINIDKVVEKSVEEVVEAPKRKRGRPRKVVTETTEEAPKAKTVKEKVKQDVKQEEITEAPKRKRGRPRKVVTETTEETTEETPKAKAVKKETKPTVKQEEVTEAPKRKRGRPRKATTDVTEEQAPKAKAVKTEAKQEVKQDNETEAPKRKRGRPKKVTNETEAADDSNKPKSKRGKTLRKRATTDKDNSVEEEVSILDELNELSTKIQIENENLKQQHEELRKQIDSTLNEIDTTLPANNEDDTTAK